MEKSEVRKTFFKAVKEIPDIDPLLRDTLRRCDKYHTRTSAIDNIERFIDNMHREIQTAQAARMFSKKGRPHSAKLLRETIFDMVKVFCHMMELRAKNNYETEAAKNLKAKKAQEQKDIENTLNGNPTGVFKEAGVRINEPSGNTGQGDQTCPVIRNKA